MVFIHQFLDKEPRSRCMMYSKTSLRRKPVYQSIYTIDVLKAEPADVDADIYLELILVSRNLSKADFTVFLPENIFDQNKILYGVYYELDEVFYSYVNIKHILILIFTCDGFW